MHDLFEEVRGAEERVQGRLRLGGCDKDDIRQVRGQVVGKGRRENRQEGLGKLSCTEGVGVLSIARKHVEDT